MFIQRGKSATITSELDIYRSLAVSNGKFPLYILKYLQLNNRSIPFLQISRVLGLRCIGVYILGIFL